MKDQCSRESSDSTLQEKVEADQEADSTVEGVLESCLGQLDEHPTPTDLEEALNRLPSRSSRLNPLQSMILREEAIRTLTKLGVRSSAGMVDQALSPDLNNTSNGTKQSELEIEPWPESVDGANLLQEIKDWIETYVFVPEDEVVAITLWVVATWFVDKAYFAPILAILSPTMRAGKTLLLDLLRCICRKSEMTSGVGATPAVIYRLNDQCHPTFLIDEAEKLSGIDGGKEIIGLLNTGYRRGSKVTRCREKKGGEYVMDQFDAFGFRAVVSTRELWSTLMDRAIVIRIKRKSKTDLVRRFNGRHVEQEGYESCRKINRFAQDCLNAFQSVETQAPRPTWLHDRACDNWAPLFAVARLAGGIWPDLALDAAKALSNISEDNDWPERLIHDIRQVYKDADWPEVIQSGPLVEYLNQMESSPWGDLRKGHGISTHKLAVMLKPFGVRPAQNRDQQGQKVRGYWLKDLRPIFDSYLPPAELGQVGQLNNDRAFTDFPSGTKEPNCPTSDSPETRVNADLSQLSHSEEGRQDKKVFEGDL